MEICVRASIRPLSLREVPSDEDGDFSKERLRCCIEMNFKTPLKSTQTRGHFKHQNFEMIPTGDGVYGCEKLETLP